MDLKAFLTPLDAPYTDAVAIRRGLELSVWYSALEDDPAKAAVAAAFATSHFWRWLALVAWSEDEKSGGLVNKPAPPLAYVKAMADHLDARGEDGRFLHDATLVLKSRQLWLSWLACHWGLYLSAKRQATRGLIISKTEDHGLELLERMGKAYAQLPRFLKIALRWPLDASRVFKTEYARFPNNSKINVLPERGGESARSFSATWTLLDEACFQQYLERAWAATVAGMTSARGRTCALMISTAGIDANTTFRDLVEDVKDGVRGGVERRHLDQTGLSLWRNKLTGVDVARIHYSADPGRRSLAWKMEAMRGFRSAAQWNKDMEMDFYALSGAPLFPMFDPTVHILRRRPIVERRGDRMWLVATDDDGRVTEYRAELGLGIDHGLKNPCGAIWLARDEQADLWAYRDYSVAGRGASENALAILGHCGYPAESVRRDWARAARRQTFARPPNEELYRWKVIDAQAALPTDSKARIEDLYKWQDGDRSKPIFGPTLKPCKKGQGSVELGINWIADMLLATLAARAGGVFEGTVRHRYWDDNNFGEDAVRAIAHRQALLISPECENLVSEIRLGRYKEFANPMLNQPETEVDAFNHVRKAIAYLGQAGMRRG